MIGGTAFTHTFYDAESWSRYGDEMSQAVENGRLARRLRAEEAPGAGRGPLVRLLGRVRSAPSTVPGEALATKDHRA